MSEAIFDPINHFVAVSHARQNHRGEFAIIQLCSATNVVGLSGTTFLNY